MALASTSEEVEKSGGGVRRCGLGREAGGGSKRSGLRSGVAILRFGLTVWFCTEVRGQDEVGTQTAWCAKGCNRLHNLARSPPVEVSPDQVFPDSRSLCAKSGYFVPDKIPSVLFRRSSIGVGWAFQSCRSTISASANVAIVAISAAADCTIGIASAAPDPSPSRIPRSSSGDRPR
jgi:hypothetical protein